MKDNKELQCECGFTIEHPWISESMEYSILNWITLIIGVTPLPKAVVTKCGACGFIFERDSHLERRKKIRF